MRERYCDREGYGHRGEKGERDIGEGGGTGTGEKRWDTGTQTEGGRGREGRRGEESSNSSVFMVHFSLFTIRCSGSRFTIQSSWFTVPFYPSLNTCLCYQQSIPLTH